MRLQGKTALITGAASGIGLATARRFAEEGASVVIADINEDAAREGAQLIEKDGGSADFVVADISDYDAVDAMIAFAVERFGSLDILHNNAYVLGKGRVHEVSREDWQKTIDICLTAYWYCTKVALGPMLEQGSGVIINTASVAGLAADYTLAAYCAAKAGVVNLTKVTALDYARKGIRCNAICPGPIWTFGDEAMEKLPATFRDELLGAVPMGRFGRPREVANLALFLATEDSGFMTGATCVIDGGMFAHTGMPSLSGEGADW